MEKTKMQIEEFIKERFDHLANMNKQIKGLQIKKLAEFAKESNEFIANFNQNINLIITENKIIDKDIITELNSFAQEQYGKRIMELSPTHQF